jgi:hypothetical protein
MLWPIDMWNDQKGEATNGSLSHEELMDYIYSNKSDPRLKKARIKFLRSYFTILTHKYLKIEMNEIG